MPDDLHKGRFEAVFESDGVLLLRVFGRWTLDVPMQDAGALNRIVQDKGNIRKLTFDARELVEWDSAFICFLLGRRRWCEGRGVEFDDQSLPEEIRRLLQLCQASDAGAAPHAAAGKDLFLENLGDSFLRLFSDTRQIFHFFGECLIAFGMLVRRRAKMRWGDTFLYMQQCGADALPIVGLISFLVGLILAFVGAVQLKKFGASIFVADLVGIAMVREMGAMMTGIIMCGRTGAAYAAQLGSMKVNEEIDAFKTFGISPIEFLVLPRVIALLVMMPILCVFADFIGILGGVVVSMGLLDLTLVQYLRETGAAITLTHFWFGIFKGACFGLLIALAGCLRGMQCGGSSSAVGLAATSAVVTGITSIIIADAVFAMLAQALGI